MPETPLVSFSSGHGIRLIVWKDLISSSYSVAVSVCQYGEIYNFPQAVFEKALEDEEMDADAEAGNEESASELEDEQEEVWRLSQQCCRCWYYWQMAARMQRSVIFLSTNSPLSQQLSS